MNKFFVLTACLLFVAAGACSAKDRTVKQAQLPVTIQQFIKKNFPKATIRKATQEEDDKDYNITLSDGAAVEFGKGNQWTELVNVKASTLHTLIPVQIEGYVSHAYPRATIKRVERCKEGYEIELNNRKTFQLDSKFRPAKFKESD